MKRTLIALALALGATAAVAEPTLDLQGTQDQSAWKNAPERTAYQAGTPSSRSPTTAPTTPSTRNATHGGAGAGNGPGQPSQGV